MSEPASLPTFITRWQASGAAERANYQLFLSELCDALDLPRPDPTVDDDTANAYVFEKTVPLPHGTSGRIDLYRRGCFVLEAKQGSDRPDDTPALSQQVTQQRQARKRGTAVRGTAAWDTAMERAREQAQGYARNLPLSEIRDGRPPFLLVVDVGRSLALYAEFSRSGGNYIPFPDPTHYRLSLADLAGTDVRTQLRQVWLDPMSLDPARRAAQVTRDIAGRLARLARSLEGQHPAEEVAHFLMRCLFTMFAEDVALLPNRAFTQLLADARHNVASFPPLVAELWRTMAHGGFSVALRLPVPHFDGGLFAEATALPLTADQLQLLIEAAQADWRDVEPAIFGTLLERALDPLERHKLGAHFTPRAYVERLVLPTIVEPLRAAWDAVKASALLLAEAGRTGEALAEVETYQQQLAEVHILDPACGSGNFLYVSLEHLKRLEGEVLEVRRQLGQGQLLLELEGLMVRPEQFHGIEVNPRAAAIAELVLWIGFLQWHRRTHGDVRPPEPILRNLHNIECRDAVLAWDTVEPLLDAAGQPVTRWDGRTKKLHPITSEWVADESARVPAWRYANPRPAEWPEADFVVGNPPFIGNKRMRGALGDGYVDALRSVYDAVPDTSDIVMYWWYRGATILRSGLLQRFGFITTNSVTQSFNRKVVHAQITDKNPISIIFAIPDHPWVDAEEGAAVRIAMTVGALGLQRGTLWMAITEKEGSEGIRQVEFQESYGFIHSDLRMGANVSTAVPLKANGNMCYQGFILVGKGFCITKEDFERLSIDPNELPPVVTRWKNGYDIVQSDTERYVIDFYGLSAEQAQQQYPALYQHVLINVKPFRDQVNRKNHRENWWIFGEPRPGMRNALANLNRYVATVETSKHKPFVFLPRTVGADHKLYAIASDDAFILGILSSKLHRIWGLAAGGRLGVGNDPTWTNSTCFLPFPFPDASEDQKARIRAIAEELDAHRKRQQAQHPKLTLTDMYNVLDKLRTGAALTAKERTVHEQGLVSVVQQLHDALDRAVSEAYGWPVELGDAEILERLVALNAARAAEEAQGLVRWLRPEFQAPAAGAAQPALLKERAAAAARYVTQPAVTPWPTRLAEQAQAVRTVLVAWGAPASAAQVAAAFSGAPAARVAEILETLVGLGQAQQLDDGWFVAS